MKRKMKKNAKGNLVIPAEVITEMRKPKYNGFQGGTGLHKNKKAYTRKEKHKTDWRNLA